MEKVEFPDLNTDQARRMALLVQLLEHCEEPETALELAERMERFVLQGSLRGGRQAEIGNLGELTKADSRVAEAVAVAVASKPHGRGGKKRRWTAEEDDKLRSLAGQDLSLEKIAAELNRTIISVRERARARQIKIKPRKRGRRPARADDSNGAGPRPAAPKNGSSHNGFANGFRSRGKKYRPCRNSRPIDSKAEAELIEKYLLERGATREEASIETVITFLRTRDYSVVRSDDGRYLLDEREHLTPSELVDRANSVRLHLGQPIFPKELAH